MKEDASPTADETTSERQTVETGLPLLKMQGQLPSGRWIVMTELGGPQEMLAVTEAGDIMTAPGRMLYGYAQTMRSFMGWRDAEDGPLQAFDATRCASAQAFRDMWSGPEYRLVEMLHLRLNRPSEDEAETFEKSLRAFS